MNVNAAPTGKRTYHLPEITVISLDNVISLILESLPPGGPFEGLNNSGKSEYLNPNPFDNMG